MTLRVGLPISFLVCVILSVCSCSSSKSSDLKPAVAPSSVAPPEAAAVCPGVPTESVSLVAKNLSFWPSKALQRNSDTVTNVECCGHNDKHLMVFYSHYGKTLRGKTFMSCQRPIGRRSLATRFPSWESWALKVKFSLEMMVGVAQSSHVVTPSFSSPSTRGKSLEEILTSIFVTSHCQWCLGSAKASRSPALGQI